jgi:hypothetical protein
MILLKKLALVVSIVFGGSLVLAAAAFAAASGGGGDLGPGSYAFTSKDASAYFGTLKGGPPGQSFMVSVDQGLNSFRPKDPKGPRTVMNSTMVTLILFDDVGNSTYGCFIINPADFTASKDLQSASVHTTLTTDEVCPGFGTPVTGTASAGPFAFGGGGTGLSLPISLDVTWTGLGVTSTGSDRNTFQCLDYSTQFISTYNASNANAAGTMSAIAGSFSTQSAVVSSSAEHATIKGAIQPACFPQ